MRKLIFIVLAFLAVFATGACQAVTTTSPASTSAGPDYDDFATLADFDEVFTLSDITYLVYFYSTECHNCANIKPQVLAFAASYTGHPIYFFNVSGTVFGDRSAFLARVGKDKLYVPYLVLVKDNDYYDSYLGATDIPPAIASITAGTLSGWN